MESILMMLLVFLPFWSPSFFRVSAATVQRTSDFLRHCPSGHVRSRDDYLCHECSICVCPGSPVQNGCLSQGFPPSHACLPIQICTTITTAIVTPRAESMQDEDQSASGMWILVIFGTLGFLFVACIAAVGVAECVNSLTHCRHGSQRELANGSVRIESGDNEGTGSIRLPSDPGLAHQNNICVMVCTAASLGTRTKTNNQSLEPETPSHLTGYSQSTYVYNREPVASMPEAKPRGSSDVVICVDTL